MKQLARVAAAGLVLLCALFATSSTPAADEGEFDRLIVPILVKNCLGCHNATESNGGLDLSTSKTVLAGGDTGPAILPKNPDESYLVEQTNTVNGPPRGTMILLRPQPVILAPFHGLSPRTTVRGLR